MDDVSYRLDLTDGTSLEVNDPWPGSEGRGAGPREGWTVGAIFLVEEVMDAGDEDDALGLTTPAYYEVWAQPPMGREMKLTDDAFSLKVFVSQVKFAHSVCRWNEAMETLLQRTGILEEALAPAPDQNQQPAPAQTSQPTAG